VNGLLKKFGALQTQTERCNNHQKEETGTVTQKCRPIPTGTALIFLCIFIGNVFCGVPQTAMQNGA
jgi:hypothetical protein